MSRPRRPTRWNAGGPYDGAIVDALAALLHESYRDGVTDDTAERMRELASNGRGELDRLRARVAELTMGKEQP